MNSTGRIASGGISDTTVSSGLTPACTSGSAPVNSPSARPMAAAISTPRPRRLRLLAVSCQNRYSPVRLLGSSAIRSMASPIWLKAGSSLSLAFSASRASEATT